MTTETPGPADGGKPLPHSWVLFERDGGHMGMYEVLECTACGAGAGWIEDPAKAGGHAFYPNGSGLKLPDDCAVSKLIVDAYELGAGRPDLAKVKPDKRMRKILRGWLDRLSRQEKEKKDGA